MKKTEIVGLIAVILILGYIVSITVDLDNYVTFADAKERSGETVTLIGKLNKAKSIDYDHEAKPQGLDRSEEITVKGTFKEGVFHASEMQMKCPSKYEENKLENLDYDENKVYTSKN
jgi:cytochrome c-type biogenesis protein CcmE